MKTIKKISLICALAFFAVSCKKEKEFLTTKTGLSHPWKLQQQGNDLNNNAKFDLNEKNNVPDSAKYTYQFKNDNNGFKVGHNNNYVDSLVWGLINNDNLLYLEVTDKGFVNKLYYKYEYGSKTLILLDTTVTPGFFMYFERQD